MGDGVEGYLMEEAEDLVAGARVITEKAEGIVAAAVAVAEEGVIEAMELFSPIKRDGVI
jgi:hypothetical protein